ncbi:hypothetical protein MUP56_00275 [Patescibacteria group bacterium]|nr:hypothetical protein [Patescibacteria group bacterium]
MDTTQIAKDLTPRQVEILKAIIEEYITTAEAVGSETLDKKYNLGVSPATIRNEMVRLTEMKLLKQPHTSSGRAPTPDALRFYVDVLMKPRHMSLTEEMSVKEKIWDVRQEMDKVLREATKALAYKTKALAITTTGDGDLYYAGVGNILDMPEFFDYELTHTLFDTIEQFDYWWKLLEGHEDLFVILLGDELGGKMLSQCGYIYNKFETSHVKGAIGVVGPFRLDYPAIVPVVRYMGNLISELGSNW